MNLGLTAVKIENLVLIILIEIPVVRGQLYRAATVFIAYFEEKKIHFIFVFMNISNLASNKNIILTLQSIQYLYYKYL